MLVILGLVLSLIGRQRPPSSARLELEGASRSLASELQLARSRAIAENRIVAVTVTQTAFARDGAPPQPLPPRITATPPGTILFAPDGSASGGSITLRDGTRVARVSVAWLTGQVAATLLP